MRNKFVHACILILVLAGASAAQTPTAPQEPAGGRGSRGTRFNGQRHMGNISAIDGDKWTLQTEDGKSLAVHIDSQTRFVKERQHAAATDFKVGDRVMVAGEPQGTDSKEISARIVASFSANSSAGFSGESRQAMAEGMGKQFIAGEVKGIDGTKLTVLRPDGQTQVIEVDENTSFRKMRDSITLADIKTGDQIFGRGELKDGVFMPTRLDVMDPQQMRDFRRRQSPAPATPAEKQ